MSAPSNSSRRFRRFAGLMAFVVAACGVARLEPARFVTFAEARPILLELGPNVPEGLRSRPEPQLEADWPAWIERHDREIRARLEQGDEDTLVNWLLFGTSFTAQPRALLGAVEGVSASDREQVLRKTIELITARMDDLLKALASPGNDERRLFARALLERKGFQFTTEADLNRVGEHLLGAVMRVANEQEAIDRDLEATSRGGDSIAEFVERSRLFRTRGLSLDTAFLPNFAIEQSLEEMKARGLLKAGAVKRVAIVGPGLDFADKDVGFDFYPQQTVQPFAVLNSLDRLGLSSAPEGADIVLFDISPRVIDHVTRALERAGQNEGYAINLPLTNITEWSPEVRRYWETFGDRIAAPVEGLTPPQALADQAELRTIRVSPAAVQHISVKGLNIVTQRVDGEAFDLIIATNVFVYYDAFEQALALSNVDAMLKPGGYLIANFSAPQLRALTIRPVETRTTVYGHHRDQRETILDFMVWYQAHQN